MPIPTDYALLNAQRNSLKGKPWLNAAGYKAPVTPVVGGGGGTGNAPNTMPAHVGGDTWEMNSNRGGVQFNGPTSYKGSFSGDGGAPIHGYEGAGLNTRDFTTATGRAPTATDVEMAQGGGLAPHHQMGSLEDYYAMLQRPSQWQQLQGPPVASNAPAMTPFSGPQWTGPDAAMAGNTMFAADGGNVPAGQPVVVGENGPEMVVPNKSITVIPNMQGNLLEYLKRFL